MRFLTSKGWQAEFARALQYFNPAMTTEQCRREAKFVADEEALFNSRWAFRWDCPNLLALEVSDDIDEAEADVEGDSGLRTLCSCPPCREARGIDGFAL